MRLGKTAKFNMILAILLCMAFVINLGSTWAAGQYRFKTQSINTVQGEIAQNNVYTDYAYTQGTQGKYIYSSGICNNQLSVNYGFNGNYDLIIRFTATYTNVNHAATDFSLNFANRNNWLVDMGTTNGLKIEGNKTVNDPTQTYYNLTSSSNTITGVMYYMGQVSGSGTMPIISSVSFYTSPNNSFEYIGDVLTITLTPEYVKSGEYDDSHIFGVDKNGFTHDVAMFGDWLSFMKGECQTAGNAKYMIYNAYVYDKSNSKDMSLQYPIDDSIVDDNSGLVNPTATPPMYSNTAYRYIVTNEGRAYEAPTAGNRYYGGLGVYVIPNSEAQSNKVVTIGITIRYVFQKDGEIAGFSPSGIVSLKTSSDITTITNGGTNYYYYKSQIDSPTYINVLDYIMLTAENYETIVNGGYSLILNYISVSLETDVNSMLVGDDGNTWSSQDKELYTTHNSTSNSPLLARVTDVLASEKSYEAEIAITNNSSSILKVKSFRVRGYLWYGEYTTTDEDNGYGGTNIVEHFVETPLGGSDKSKCYLGPNYLTDQYENQEELRPENIWKYDSSVWSVECLNNVYTFTNNSGVVYIPSGYTITLIGGITIPQTSTCQDQSVANDFWCTIEVLGITFDEGDPTYSNLTTTSAIETIVEGYYSEITSTNPGKIYIRNNTNQEITKLVLSNNINPIMAMPLVYSLNPTETDLPRDRLGSLIRSVNIINHLNKTSPNLLTADNISIKPNETVLAYTIEVNQNAIIYDYKITATLANYAYDNDIDLVYNAETNRCEIVNNSSKFYEFRLFSTTSLNLTNSDDFVEKQEGDTYYYYYKGVICPNQCFVIYSGDFISNVIIGESDKIEHDNSWDAGHYVADNYDGWDDEWLDAMRLPFTEPTDEERQNAIKVN